MLCAQCDLSKFPGTWILHILRERHPPVVTSLWIVASVLVFSYCQDYAQQLMLSQITITHSPWQCVTYALFHRTVEHLMGNVLMILILGGWFEFVNGHRKTLVMMLLCAIVSGWTHVVYKCHIGQPNALKGGSGVVFGLMLCPVASLVMNWSEMWLRWLRLVLFVTLAIVTVVVQGSFGCLEGHVSGACFGLVWNIFDGENLIESVWERRLSYAMVPLVMLYAVTALYVCIDSWPIGVVFITIWVPATVMAQRHNTTGGLFAELQGRCSATDRC